MLTILKTVYCTVISLNNIVTITKLSVYNISISVIELPVYYTVCVVYRAVSVVHSTEDGQVCVQ